MASSKNGDPVAAFFAKAADVVADIAGSAVTDIRHKLVEELWFGREVTPTAESSMSEQLGWTKAASTPWDALCSKLAAERGHRAEPEPAHEHEIER